MRANQASYPVRTLCSVLGVSPSGYYAWRQRSPSARAVSNTSLLERIREIHRFSRQTYGRPRIYAELRDEGVVVNHKRVARLMKPAGLAGVSRRCEVALHQTRRWARLPVPLRREPLPRRQPPGRRGPQPVF